MLEPESDDVDGDVDGEEEAAGDAGVDGVGVVVPVDVPRLSLR